MLFLCTELKVSVVFVLSSGIFKLDACVNQYYWKYLKSKLKKENNELGSDTTQLKLGRLKRQSERFGD